jgi:quercetin dioxygenase-like cupin family protein
MPPRANGLLFNFFDMTNMNSTPTAKPNDTLFAVQANDLPWVDWAMPGSKFKLLHADPKTGFFTLMIKFEKGVTAPVHRHIGTVEGYMLEGGFHYADDPSIRFTAGSYLFEADGAVHQPVSPDGALMFAVFHGPVEGLDEAGNVTGRVGWRWHVETWNAAGGNFQCEMPPKKK